MRVETILCSSCTCEKWVLTLIEEYILQVFGKNIRKIFGPTRDEVSEQFRKLRNEELRDLYKPDSIVGAEVALSV